MTPQICAVLNQIWGQTGKRGTLRISLRSVPNPQRKTEQRYCTMAKLIRALPCIETSHELVLV
jgi:hypothetical protein